MKVGEIRAYLSDLTLHQSRAVLDATLQVRGTVVGVAILHPPGSSHPGTGAWDPAVTVPQGSSVTFSDGAMENTVVCVRSCPAVWDTGKMGFAERGCPCNGNGWAAGHSSALQPQGSHPQHRAESVTCNPVKMQSLVNVNISSLKSLVKETRKCVACM